MAILEPSMASKLIDCLISGTSYSMMNQRLTQENALLRTFLYQSASEMSDLRTLLQQEISRKISESMSKTDISVQSTNVESVDTLKKQLQISESKEAHLTAENSKLCAELHVATQNVADSERRIADLERKIVHQNTELEMMTAEKSELQKESTIINQKLLDARQIAANLEGKISQQKTGICRLREKQEFSTPSCSKNYSPNYDQWSTQAPDDSRENSPFLPVPKPEIGQAMTAFSVQMTPQKRSVVNYETARNQWTYSWNFSYRNLKQISRDPVMRYGVVQYLLWTVLDYESLRGASLNKLFHHLKKGCYDFLNFFKLNRAANPNYSPYDYVPYHTAFAEFFQDAQEFLPQKLRHLERIRGRRISPGRELEFVLKTIVIL